MLVYAVWDTETANLVGAHEEEAAALPDVREAVERFGRSYAASWGLSRKETDGELTPIADADDLIDRALRTPRRQTERAGRSHPRRGIHEKCGSQWTLPGAIPRAAARRRRVHSGVTGISASVTTVTRRSRSNGLGRKATAWWRAAS